MSKAVSADPRRVAEHSRAGRLAAAALEFARFARPDLDPEPYLARLQSMAAAVQGATHLSLRRVISITEGFGGNVDDYHHPNNSLLDRVIDTRRGLPISLCVLWIEVGRRAAMDVQPVALPGHFLVYAAGQLCDPFHGGEAIGFDEAAGLVASALGGPPRLDRSWLEPVADGSIIARMLTNLGEAYARLGENHPWVADCLSALQVDQG